MPKTATNILKNGLFDIPRFYEKLFRNGENRSLQPRSRSLCGHYGHYAALSLVHATNALKTGTGKPSSISSAM